MPVTITDHGQRNRVVAPPAVLSEQQGRIVFDGDDNTVVLGEGTLLQGGRIHLGSACSFTCGSGCRLASIEVHAALRGTVRIGDQTGFTWHSLITLHEPGEIVFGAGCLIAGGTALTVSDMHSVIDVKTRRRLNPAKDVHLGDRVWLGEGVRVLKGVTIGTGSIIGAEAVVTKKIPPNSMAVGSPARVVRSGVTWRQELLPVEGDVRSGGGGAAVGAARAAVDAGVPAGAADDRLPPRWKVRDIPGLHRTADGRIISWAQNAEDVMLLRIFGHKKQGTWIDVGANHPSHNSVTRNLYELGWRGINVEPVENLHRLLVAERPEDINVCGGISDRTGEMVFHQDESHLDCSTFDTVVAGQHATAGHAIRDMPVPVMTLAEICTRHLQPGQRIDFLKLDVQGHDLAVLAGHDFAAHRPAVIVVEIKPEHSSAVDAMLGQRGYVKRFFDGASNWYVDSLSGDAFPSDIWRLSDSASDGYFPWPEAESKGAIASLQSALVAETPAAVEKRASPAAKNVLQKAADAVRSAMRSIGAPAARSEVAPPDAIASSTQWLLGRCACDPASFIQEIHPNDDVYLYGRNYVHNDELAKVLYLRYGAWAMQDLSQIVSQYFGNFHKIGRMLEFACGYGRLTRFLVEQMPRERLWVSDVDPQAVAFERRTFGVNGFVSASNPDEICCDERFDLIFVVSLFSHLPRHAFGPMLDKLLSMLTPSGILAFTVHDDIWCPPGMMQADGFAFVPNSESSHLSTDDYGTTFVTEAFVRDCIAAGRGAGWPYVRLRRGLCSHQDMYLVSNDASVRYEGLKFRLGPEGCLDRCEAASGGGLELSGWAGDPDPDHHVSEIQIRLDGRLVRSCQPVIPRPDVVAVLREPRYATAGWQCVVDVGAASQAGDDRMLDITVVSDDGRTRLLHASRVGAVVGRRLV